MRRTWDRQYLHATDWVRQGGCVRARAHERRNGAEGYEAAGSKTSQGLRQMRRSLRCGWCECGRVRGIAVPQSASPQSARPCFSRCTPAARSSTALEMPTMQTEARAVRCAVDANRACINHSQRHRVWDTRGTLKQQNRQHSSIPTRKVESNGFRSNFVGRVLGLV